jgi:hypothetical protein
MTRSTICIADKRHARPYDGIVAQEPATSLCGRAVALWIDSKEIKATAGLSRPSGACPRCWAQRRDR